MAKYISLDPEPITYQIVISSFPPDEPLPSWNADATTNPKPHKAKYQSYNAYMLLQVFSVACMYWVNPATFTLSALVGAAKPFYDWKFCKALPPKDLDTDDNPKDWGKLDYINKVKVAVNAFLFPFFVAEATAGAIPFFSMGTSAAMGFLYFYDLSQRAVRWVNPAHYNS